MVTTSWDGIIERYGDQYRAGLIHPLYIYGMTRPAETAAIPSITEFGRNDAEKAFLQSIPSGRKSAAPSRFHPAFPDTGSRCGAPRLTMLDDPEFRHAVAKSDTS